MSCAHCSCHEPLVWTVVTAHTKLNGAHRHFVRHGKFWVWFNDDGNLEWVPWSELIDPVVIYAVRS